MKNLNSESNLIHGCHGKNILSEKENKELMRAVPGGETFLSDHLKWYLEALKIPGKEVHILKQVHSDRIYILEDENIDSNQVARIEGDAIVTCLSQKPIAIVTADCIPVIVYDSKTPLIAVVHAGRKGTASNILYKTLQLVKQRFKCKPDHIQIGLGPGIGGCCYEVDQGCILPFQKNFLGWKQFVVPKEDGKFFLDLFAANREDALRADIPISNVSVAENCTACEDHRFYSYRKQGKTGRMMTLAMLR